MLKIKCYYELVKKLKEIELIMIMCYIFWTASYLNTRNILLVCANSHIAWEVYYHDITYLLIMRVGHKYDCFLHKKLYDREHAMLYDLVYKCATL